MQILVEDNSVLVSQLNKHSSYLLIIPQLFLLKGYKKLGRTKNLVTKTWVTKYLEGLHIYQLKLKAKLVSLKYKKKGLQLFFYIIRD
jgi:hypothetical protein